MAQKKRTVRNKAPAAPAETGDGFRPVAGFFWLVMILLTVGAAAFPVVISRAVNDPAAPGGFLLPLILWSAFTVLTFALIWRKGFTGDRAFVILTVLLLGLGMTLQLRLNTWAESWSAWRAYAPVLLGMGIFLFSLACLSPRLIAGTAERLKWLLWLAAPAIIGVLFLFGRSYRGGTFLPGQMNPTELVKLVLVAFAAVWLPAHREGLSRTVFGVPCPPLRETAALAVLWGIPLLGGIAVRDLGLVLILSLTLVVMLTVLTGRIGWFLFGLLAAGASGWGVRLLSTHARRRFDVWLDPFQDPTGSGWQIGQSLCAQHAGGLWGVGLGEGTPGAVPIVSSDFIYAAVAEEWGLVGCGCLLLICWLWLLRAARSGAQSANPAVRLMGAGFAAVLGVQIVLNVGGVTKALPMTGITFPLLSQGGFSLLTVLLMCGLIAVLSADRSAGMKKRRTKEK